MTQTGGLFGTIIRSQVPDRFDSGRPACLRVQRLCNTCIDGVFCRALKKGGGDIYDDFKGYFDK